MTRLPLSLRPIRTLALPLAAAGALLSGCAYDGYGYGGVSAGAGYYGGGYYDDYYGYDSYGYGGGWYGYPAYGWYDDFYYPGNGVWVYDRTGRRHAMRDRDRDRWIGRGNAGRPDRPGGQRPGQGRPGDGASPPRFPNRPDQPRPGQDRPNADNGRRGQQSGTAIAPRERRGATSTPQARSRSAPPPRQAPARTDRRRDN